MKKNKKLKFISLIFLSLFVLFCQTIVYSAINSTMSIRGDAYARAEADVRITNFRLASATNATSSFEEFGKTHVITELDLTDATSSITYYVEITNYGSADVGIFDITGLPDEVNYSIKNYNLHDKICDDNGTCNSFIKQTYELTLTTTSSYTGSIQLDFDFRTYHTVIYTDITNNNYPTEVIDGGNLNITFTESLKRVQVLSNNTELGYYTSILSGQTITIEDVSSSIELKSREPSAFLVSGELNEVGSEVCIGEECFYIISNDGSTVTLLTKYNLHVGYKHDDTYGTTLLTNPTGKQDVTARAWFAGYTTENPLIGVIPFSKTNYWSNITEYPTYVYNSNSTLYQYVEAYKSYIEQLGVPIDTARLIKVKELESLGCSTTDYNCSAAPNWVYSTTYWTGDAFSSDAIWRVSTDSHFYDNGSGSYANGDTRGVRPVIEIPVGEIEPLVRIESGDLDTAGSEISIGKEHFYVISSDDNTTTMLAKYNLYVGGVHDGTTWTAYGNEATGKQDSTMLGYIEGQTLRNGTTIFSTTNYWESTTSSYPAYVYNKNATIYNYVENYKAYLSTLGSTPKGARVITYEELEALGCDGGNYSCSGAPRWVYSTSYWTGSAAVGWKMWYLYSHSKLTFNYNTEDRYFGVRPVITISKLELSTKIKFTINSTTYYATKGMTWSEWLNSNLSPEEMEQYATNGVYYPEFSYAYIYQNGTQVLFNEQIINNGEYTAKANGD